MEKFIKIIVVVIVVLFGLLLVSVDSLVGLMIK